MAVKNVLIVGGAGYRNSGDEALLLASVQVVRSILPMANIFVAANNVDVASDTLADECVQIVPSVRISLMKGDMHYSACDDVFQERWLALRKRLVLSGSQNASDVLASLQDLDFVNAAGAKAFLDAFFLADAVVVHGGGVLTSATRSRLWEYSLTVEMASKFSKLVLARSQQIGPFDTADDRARIKSLIRGCSYISTRDKNQSSQAVRDILDVDCVYEGVDDAFVMERTFNSRKILESYGLEPRRYICLGFRQNSRAGVSEQALERTCVIANMARNELSARLVLLPQGPFDVSSLVKIKNQIGGDASVIEPKDYFRDPVAIASNARAMIASPHHSLIFSLRGGVPILSPVSGAYYSFKNKGSMRFFGLEDFVIDIDDDGYVQQAQERLQYMAIEGDALANKIARTSAELRSLALQGNIGFAKTLLGG